MTDRLVGRSDLLRAAARFLRRGDPGVAVVGPRGAGVSSVLIRVALDARAQGRRVRHVVAPHFVAPHFVDPADGAGPTTELLVVDDADRLDPATAETLRAAAVEGAVQLVAGWHTPEAVPGPLAWCAASGLLTRLDVGPFGVDDTVAYLESRLGAGIHRASAATLGRYGAGLPAWIAPACDAALAAGHLERRAGLWRCTALGPPIPAMLDRARGELARLAPGDADAFGRLCVAGAMPLRFATTLLGADTIGRLERSGLVAVDDTVTAAVPALADAVRTVVGRAASAAIASGLVAAADASVAATDLARWRVAAHEPVSSAECALAAEDARRRGDDATAERLARRAADAGDRRAMWLLAEILQGHGRRTEAVEVLAHLGGVDAPDGLADLARIEHATILLWDLARPDEAVAMVDELVRRAPGRRTEREVRAAAAATTLFAGRPADATVLAAALLDGADHAAATAWMVAAAAGAVVGDGAAAVAAARRARSVRAGLAAAPGAAGPEVHLAVLVLALGEAGALREADATARAAYDGALRAPPGHARVGGARVGARVPAHRRGNARRAARARSGRRVRRGGAARVLAVGDRGPGHRQRVPRAW
ncbi:MAG: hypothetical protein KatS3mg010_0852 [Acidimicrobiia bacterium]|nr:MAG: hypothetical protein KatS3mg010_0852 [Acidimicrobiia bacterium]